MKNSRVDLNLIDKDNHAPVGYKEINCQLIFNVKMDLTRKGRYMSGGNHTNTMPHASVVIDDIVRLTLLIAEVNNLDI